MSATVGSPAWAAGLLVAVVGAGLTGCALVLRRRLRLAVHRHVGPAELLLGHPPAGRGHPARLELTDAARSLLLDVEPLVRESNSPDVLGLSDQEVDTLRTLLLKVLPAVS